MHGFTPEHALQSITTFIGYYGLPMVAKYDKSTKEYVKASPTYIYIRIWEVFGAYIYTGALYSLFILYPDYFPTLGGDYEPGYFQLSNIYTARNLRNCGFWTSKFQILISSSFIFYPMLFSFFTIIHSFPLFSLFVCVCVPILYSIFTIVAFEATLSTSGNGGNFVSTLITGYEMESFMNNAIWESTTCSDFWNRRWNKLIQTLLSRGIFKPARSIFSLYMALPITFLVSGLFHEWLMSIIFAPLPEQLDENGNCIPPKCFQLTHGSAIVFFIWISFIMLMEFTFLPKVIHKKPHIWYQTFIAIFTGIMGIWFLDPYVHTTFFNEGYPGYFMVNKVSQE